MAGWNGSGTFVRLYNWVADKLAAVPITASRMDGEFDNYKTGLENCVTRDGQTPATANIPMGGFKFTGLGNGSSSTDSAAYGQIAGLTRRNMLANGGFDVWQAGAGGSAAIAGATARTRGADCWWGFRTGSVAGYTMTQATGEVNRFAMKWQRDNANASTANMLLAQSLETANVVWIKRGTPPSITVSFYAKKGANYSGGDLTAELIRGTGTDQNVLDTYTGATTLGAAFTQTLTTTLTRYSFTRTADTSTNELGVQFKWTPVGVAGADDSVTIENVQCEVGTTYTDFEYLSFGETLRRCMRYFEKSFQYTVAPAQNVGVGTSEYAFGATLAGAVALGPVVVPLAAVKRTLITPTIYNPAGANAFLRDETAGADGSGLTIGLNAAAAYFTAGFTGNAATAAGNYMGFHWTVADPNF